MIKMCSDKVCCTKIINLSVKVEGKIILENINLHLHCRSLTAIIGQNGAGKTTFLKALLGEVPYKGEILFTRENTHKTGKPRFGYVPQSLLVDPSSPVTVSDMVLSSLQSYPVFLPRRKCDTKKVLQVLSTTEVESLFNKKVATLSGGQLQRVMLSMAINPLPDILLLDEPVAGVDRAGVKLFYDLVSNLRKSKDITILLISHDIDLVANYADRVLLIDHGIKEEGTPKQVYNTKAFHDTFGTVTLESI